MPPPAGPPGLGGPPGLPGGMPPPGLRKRGGRVGVQNQGPGDKMPENPPGWTESAKHKTPVQHTDGKQDGANIGRGKPITYRRGGGVKDVSVPVKAAQTIADPVSRRVHQAGTAVWAVLKRLLWKSGLIRSPLAKKASEALELLHKNLMWPSRAKDGEYIWMCDYIQAPQRSGSCDRCGGRWVDYERPSQCAEPIRRAA